MKNEYMAIQDIPLGEGNSFKAGNLDTQDKLGISKHAEALSIFISTCGTPMTIAIQGDSGTGKTSLMRLVESKSRDEIEPIWFNTWQYSQLLMEDSLSLSFVRAIVYSIVDPGNLAKTGKFVISAMLKIGEISATRNPFSNMLIKGMNVDDLDPLDNIEIIQKLKEAFKKACTEKLKNSKKTRIVIFIDDLDRIKPSKAIELLETLKIFLDVENCVFVLAMDYNVVKKGLKEVLGNAVDSNMTKNFFDKIIQLPFKMPVESYDIKNYLKSLFELANIETDDKTIFKYKEILTNSIGINPRSAKRLVNVLTLMKIVAEIDSENNNKENDTLNINTDLLLFSLACMQESFEKLYLHMAHDLDCKGLFTNLYKLSNEDFDNVDNEISKLIETDDSDQDDDNNRLQLVKAAKFLKTFLKLIDDNNNGIIDNKESEYLKKLMGWVSITSIDIPN